MFGFVHTLHNYAPHYAKSICKLVMSFVHRFYFVHTAQDTTLFTSYGGHWSPLHVAVTKLNRAPSVFPLPPGTVSGL